MSDLSHIERICETFYTRDPLGTTIPIGGAAMNLQLAAAGVAYEPASDVDVICPTEYMDKLWAEIPTLKGLASATIKWWSPHNSPTISILPDSTLYPNLLRFDACAWMNDFYPITHDALVAEPHRLATVFGIRCIRLGEALIWRAMVGRDRDWASVRTVWPLATEAGLLSSEENARIVAQLAMRK